MIIFAKGANVSSVSLNGRSYISISQAHIVFMEVSELINSGFKEERKLMEGVDESKIHVTRSTI